MQTKPLQNFIFLITRQEDLYHVLKAYSLYDAEVGYCQVIFSLNA